MKGRPMAQPYNLQSYRADTGKPFTPRSGFWSWLQGNPGMIRQVPVHSPEIQGDINSLLSSTFQGLQNLQSGFEPIAQQAQNQFQTQTVPGLAERFTAMGGGQRSSAFQNALGSAGSGLQQNLAAMGSQYGLQNRTGLLDQLKLGLLNQPKYEFTTRQGGALENIFGPLLGGQAGKYGGQGAQDFVSILTGLLPYLL
jgi:hypothetical protein